MKRNVFISVLGSSKYSECVYVDHFNNYKSESVRFIQEAVISKTTKDWSEDDRLIIFLTKGKDGSRAKNWEDSTTGVEGLASRIKKLNIAPVCLAYDIPNGNNTDEIWEIFEIIYSKLQNGDKLYIDITHGFRYLPMLVVVLGNYAKFLKDITIESISYGNFEGRDQENSEAPIVDLTSFSTLQDWTNAINEFVKSGTSMQFSAILKDEIQTLEKKDRQMLEKFINSLNAFTKATTTIRGKIIYSGKLINDIRLSSKAVKKQSRITALAPVIEKLEDYIADFEGTESLRNGEVAINWCLDHNLIQQAYTLGQEHIVSIICKMFAMDYKNKTHRIFVTSTIGYINDKRKNSDKQIYDILARNVDMFERIASDKRVQEISEPFAIFSGRRNTLNHAGMVGDISADEIILQFKDIFFSILHTLKQGSDGN